MHEIPHVFRREALAEAEAARPAGLAGREDWRDLPLVTIDPIDAKDHDDAVFAEPDTDPTNPGGFIVTVAIADVAHYVRPGSALDREAVKRGNSVYFPDRVVPMLPERISNDLCSLKPNVDRAALAATLHPLFGHDLAEQPPIVMQQLRAMSRFDAGAKLAALAGVPTLVVSATEDRSAAPATGRALAALIPGATYREVSDAGHGLPIHRAAEVNTLLAEHWVRAD